MCRRVVWCVSANISKEPASCIFMAKDVLLKLLYPFTNFHSITSHKARFIVTALKKGSKAIPITGRKGP
jgi:hypothetical protein